VRGDENGQEVLASMSSNANEQSLRNRAVEAALAYINATPFNLNATRLDCRVGAIPPSGDIPPDPPTVGLWVLVSLFNLRDLGVADYGHIVQTRNKLQHTDPF
jgi:hypothetical protein